MYLWNDTEGVELIQAGDMGRSCCGVMLELVDEPKFPGMITNFRSFDFLYENVRTVNASAWVTTVDEHMRVKHIDKHRLNVMKLSFDELVGTRTPSEGDVLMANGGSGRGCMYAIVTPAVASGNKCNGLVNKLLGVLYNLMSKGASHIAIVYDGRDILMEDSTRLSLDCIFSALDCMSKSNNANDVKHWTKKRCCYACGF